MNPPAQYPMKILLEYVKNDKSPIKAGYLIIGKDHDLATQPFDTPISDLFVGIVNYINDQKIIHMKAHPPENIKAKPHENFSRIVKKGDEDYVKGVLYELHEIHGFSPVIDGNAERE